MEQKPLNLLIVEDSGFSAAVIREKLAAMPFSVQIEQADTLKVGRELLTSGRFDLAIIDLHLPDGMGSDLLPEPGRGLICPIIVLTSHGSEKSAVDAIKRGAFDFIVKSKEALDNLPHVVTRVLREWQLYMERKEFEKALTISEKRFRSLFTMVSAGMVVLNEELRLVQVNPAFCSFLGYTEEELTSMYLEDITHPDDRRETKAHYRELFSQSPHPIHYEKRYYRKDGRQIWGYVSVSRMDVYEDVGERLCVALVQDISTRVQAEHRLQDVNRELDAFVHSISHDLRASLTPMINIPDLLRERLGDSLDDESDQLLECVEDQADKMLALMEDLLALAQVGSVKRPETPVDVTQVAQGVTNVLEEKIFAAEVSVEIAELEPIRLPETFLSQIFLNLIGNAIAYGGIAGGRIKVGSDRQKRVIRYFVRDHGPGIATSEQEKVFDLFYRAKSSKGKQGTGIGLGIVRKMVRQFDGNVWVTDTPGGGSTFWVEFPHG